MFGLLALCPASVVMAVDLSVASIEITQGLQTATGGLPLIARNATMVRVKIALVGPAQPGVDALLRIYSNGIEIPESPVYSSNGPITAPVVPLSNNIDDTINFLCLPPEGADIDFVVTVNAFNTVVESDYTNNTLSVLDKAFLCRRMAEIAYVPVNYTPGGGLPNAAMIEPGSGDTFLRAIYKTGDWNYHRSPLPTYTHTQDIIVSNILLLNMMNDIRQNQIPAAGFTRPDFVFGWLPGNPFTGNGQAISTPGGAAFGNTDPLRFQRTFAHEIGHCWGQPHNQVSISVVGFDIERQLRDPLGIAAVMPATKRDVMVAGLNTPDAWVASITYLDAIDDARSACAAFDGGGGGGGDGNGDGGGGPANDSGGVLRIAGTHDHVLHQVRLEPTMEQDGVDVTEDNARGNVLVESFAADGVRLHAVRVDTLGCRESCGQAGHLHRETSLFVNLPRVVGGRETARVLVRDVGDGRDGRKMRDGHAVKSLAQLVRSAHAPEITNFAVTPAHPGDISSTTLVGRMRVDWSARDADGDPVVADLLYSPDGANAWFPVVLGVQIGANPGAGTDTFEFESAQLPASRGAHGQFAMRASDGMNNTRRRSGSFAFGQSAPPDVHVISPNETDSVPDGATVILHGSAWDIDDQLLPEASVTWTSSRDGAIGTGRLLARRNLSVGTHIITVRGTDSGGLWAERSVTITVTPRVYNNANLDGIGVVNAFDLMIMLSTWGQGGVADIDLNGVVSSPDLAELVQRWGY